MIVNGYEILYTLFNTICFPLRYKADAFIVHGCFIAHCFCGVVLTTVTGRVCLDKLLGLPEDRSELLELQSINSSN